LERPKIVSKRSDNILKALISRELSSHDWRPIVLMMIIPMIVFAWLGLYLFMHGYSGGLLFILFDLLPIALMIAAVHTEKPKRKYWLAMKQKLKKLLLKDPKSPEFYAFIMELELHLESDVQVIRWK